MSVGTTLSRIAEIETALVPQAPTAEGTEAASGGRFAQVLGATAALGGGNEAGMRAVEFARGEVGQAEQPPGSNDSPRIAQYREAVTGAGVGPWCADFVSWAARQAGAPL